MAPTSTSFLSPNVVEQTPNWSKINCALQLLLCDQQPNPLANLKPIGSSQRLDYEQFETIFFQLFLQLDPADTRRKFRGFQPARNKEEQSRFIAAAMRFINDKQLAGQRVSSVSQLKMFGGEPFRRLLAALIAAAQQRQIRSIGRQLAANNASSRSPVDAVVVAAAAADTCGSHESRSLDVDNSNQNYLAELAYQQQQSKLVLERLRHSLERFREARSRLGEAKQSQEVKWNQLAARLELKAEPGNFSRRQINPICSQLFSRLERANEEIKLSSYEIKSIKLPAARDHARPTDELLSGSDSSLLLPTREPKRVSQYIREMKVRLEPDDSSSTANDQPAAAKENILQQLGEYDYKVAFLVDSLREAADRADERFLQDSENLDRFKQLEKKIPLIELNGSEPAAAATATTTTTRAKDIGALLAKFPDSRYDDREVMESVKRYFE